MRPYEHNGQIHVPKRKPAFKTHATMIAVGAACFGLVTLGWVEGVRSTVKSGVAGASETFTGAGSAFTELRSRTTTPADLAAQAETSVDASLSPYLDAAEERMQALDLVSELVKEQIESSPTDEESVPTTPSSPAGKDAPPPAKNTPPDVSPEPTE